MTMFTDSPALLNPDSLIAQHTRIQLAKSEAPLGFLKWSGIMTLAATCGRQVYTRLLGPRGPVMYPNLFVLLIAKPGIGKTTAINAVKEQLTAMKIRFSPDAISASKFVSWASQASIDALEKGKDPGFVVALPNMDSLFNKRTSQELKSFLVAAYDCSDSYLKSTQDRGHESIYKMCMNMLAGGTPAHIGSCFQPSDWGEGLASRFMLVMEQYNRIGDLPEWPDSLHEDYSERIRLLRESLTGQQTEITWTPEAWRAREAWRIAHQDSLPPHPAAAGYWGRRDVGAVKLSMLLAISQHQTTISLSEWDGATAELESIEKNLPAAFFHTGGNPYAALSERIVAWAKREGRVVQEHEIRIRLNPHVQPRDVQSLIDSILASHQLIGVGSSPNREIHHPDNSIAKNASSGVTTWEQVLLQKRANQPS